MGLMLIMIDHFLKFLQSLNPKLFSSYLIHVRNGIIGISITLILVSFGSMTNLVFAQESLSWKSEYRAGILNSEDDSLIPVKVTTFSKDSLQLQWQEPDIAKNQKIIGYEILRKDLNSNYHVIIENMNQKKMSYIDRNLDDGYYAYKIIPILQKIEISKITMHGIDRHHNLFSTYVGGQQLLAYSTLGQYCPRCFDESFEEINNIFQYEFSDENKRTRQSYQSNIDSEVLKATHLFDILFDVTNNH